MTASMQTSLSVAGLRIVTPDGRLLLQGGHIELGAGEVALLIGPSGSGKSTIINVLSGLLVEDGGRWDVSGILEQNGTRFDLSQDLCDVGGLVFQGNALFDDLSAVQNLSIAIDHSGDPDPELPARLGALLQDIAPDQGVSSLSGGQRQRVAIARTLLAKRPLLLFDEPNSGLDRYAALRLAGLVKDICRDMGRPALIVAHHFDDLLPLADKVLVLDPVRKSLHHLPPEREAIERALITIGEAVDAARSKAAPELTPASQRWEDRIARRPVTRWFAYYMREYFWILCASPLTLLYVLSGAAIVGFVTMWFGFNYDLLGEYMRSFVHDEALMGIGFIEATIVVPLICCILIVARNNAIITADLGNRVYSSQFRAMRNLHIPGRIYLASAILVNMVLGALLLVCLSISVAGWASFKTWQVLFPSQPFELWREHFFRVFVEHPNILWRNVGWGLLKTVSSIVVATLIALQAGFGPKDSVIAINYAIARSIVLGVSVTLLIHASIAILQF